MSYKQNIKKILALDDHIKIKAPIKIGKEDKSAVPVILDSGAEVYFLIDYKKELVSSWYYQKENLIFSRT